MTRRSKPAQEITLDEGLVEGFQDFPAGASGLGDKMREVTRVKGVNVLDV